MFRRFVVLPLVAVLLCAFLISLAVPKAHAASAHVASTCHVSQLVVHANGSRTISCLQATSKSSTKVSPNTISSPPCPADDLVLYYNGPFGSAAANNGPILCVYGNSNTPINLTVTVNGVSWNDKASAWWTGCQDVEFFVDSNGQGGIAYAAGSDYGFNSPAGNFPYQNVGNDQLSSVEMYSNHLC